MGAYELGLRPWEVDRLSPGEAASMIDGARRRGEREARIAAAAALIVASRIPSFSDRPEPLPPMHEVMALMGYRPDEVK